MAKKRSVIPFPDLAGKSLLDVGCDHGYWCQLGLDDGAVRILGLDRGRDGIDLVARNRDVLRACNFERIDLGRQWFDYGRFDVTLCLSMYHHVFQNAGDHLPIWFWLWRHTGGELLWENPTGVDDDVVKLNVTRPGYNRQAITDAAFRYFDVEFIGQGHVATREVWRCAPKWRADITWRGGTTTGGGGASRAFQFADGRRMGEIEAALGFRPYPGTLNLWLDHPFCWSKDYYRVELTEARDRANLQGEWAPRWCRFYPVKVEGIPAFAMRFEGESYDEKYVELISSRRLRDHIGERVLLCSS